MQINGPARRGMDPRATEILLLKKKCRSMGPCIAGYYSAKKCSNGPVHRGIRFCKKCSNGPVPRRYYSAKKCSNGPVHRGIRFCKKCRSMDPRAAEWTVHREDTIAEKKYRSMGPRAAEWARAPRNGPARRGMGPRAAEWTARAAEILLRKSFNEMQHLLRLPVLVRPVMAPLLPYRTWI
jgi:hypothetical protein